MNQSIKRNSASRKVGCYCPRGQSAQRILTSLGLEVWENPEEFPYFAYDPVTYVVGIDGDVPPIRPCDTVMAVCELKDCASLTGLPEQMAVWLIEGAQIVWKSNVGDLLLFARLIKEHQPFTRDKELYALIARFERFGLSNESRHSILRKLMLFGFDTRAIRELLSWNLGGYHEEIEKVRRSLPPVPTEWIPSPIPSWMRWA